MTFNEGLEGEGKKPGFCAAAKIYIINNHGPKFQNRKKKQEWKYRIVSKLRQKQQQSKMKSDVRFYNFS
jgi:hypothetical protein